MSEHFPRPNSDSDDLFSGHFPDTYSRPSDEPVDRVTINRSVDGVMITPNLIEKLITVISCAAQFLPKWPTNK